MTTVTNQVNEVNEVTEPAPYAAYQALLATGQIAFQRCQACAEAIFYPRTLCPQCGATDLAWESSAGQGTVYSTTTVPVRDGDAYAVCLVDLDEGFRMMSTVVDLPAGDVRIGQRVTGRIERVPDGQGEDGEHRVVFCGRGGGHDE
jgi:uncharacterized OB-fold protein